jgi:hypothetical protein
VRLAGRTYRRRMWMNFPPEARDALAARSIRRPPKAPRAERSDEAIANHRFVIPTVHEIVPVPDPSLHDGE